MDLQIGKQCKQGPLCVFLQISFPASLKNLLAKEISLVPIDIIHRCQRLVNFLASSGKRYHFPYF